MKNTPSADQALIFDQFIRKWQTKLSLGDWLIAATGLAYAVVAVDQFIKGNVNGAGMWAGYAFAQVFLWRAAL